jgi:hypothetical protein
MTTDGGGWTLVGRSRNTPSNPGCAGTDGLSGGFGWRTAAGNLNDDGQAYSLDVAGKACLHPGPVRQPQRRQELQRQHLPPHRRRQLRRRLHQQPLLHRRADHRPGRLRRRPPAMFNWIGFTGNTNSFHFRDVDGNDFGLFISGWRSCYDDCQGGNLNGHPGLIFVR